MDDSKTLPKSGNSPVFLNSPYSEEHFVAPQASTPKELVNWMIALQVKHYGQSFDLPYLVLVRNMNLLLKKYSVEQVQRGIAAAVEISEYPFTTALVRKMIRQLEKTTFKSE